MNKKTNGAVSNYSFRSWILLCMEEDEFKASGILEIERLVELKSICEHLSLLVEDIKLSIDENHKCIKYFLSGKRYISGSGQVKALLKVLTCLHKYSEATF